MSSVSLGEGISCISNGLNTDDSGGAGGVNLGTGISLRVFGIVLTSITKPQPPAPPDPDPSSPSQTKQGSFSSSFSRSFSGGPQ